MGSVMTCKLNPCCGDRRNCTPPERYGVPAPGPAGEAGDLIERLTTFEATRFEVTYSGELQKWLLANAELRREAASALAACQAKVAALTAERDGWHERSSD